MQAIFFCNIIFRTFIASATLHLAWIKVVSDRVSRFVALLDIKAAFSSIDDTLQVLYFVIISYSLE